MGILSLMRRPSRMDARDAALLPIRESLDRSVDEVAAVGHRRSVEGHHDVARPQACVGTAARPWRRMRGDPGRPACFGNAELLREHCARSAARSRTSSRSIPRLDHAELLQVGDDPAGEVARDGEPDALVAAAPGEDGGVDPDELPGRFISAPPEFPGLIAASVWMKSS